jgi:hypothetical protein
MQGNFNLGFIMLHLLLFGLKFYRMNTLESDKDEFEFWPCHLTSCVVLNKSHD